MRKFGVFLLFLVLSHPASAWSSNRDKQLVTDTVVSHPARTYGELLKLIGGLQGKDADRTISNLPQARALLKDEAGEKQPGPFDVPGFEALSLKAPGQDWVVLLIDFGPQVDNPQGYALLALFDMKGPPRLMDVVDIAADKRVRFEVPARIAIGDGADILLVRSERSIAKRSFFTHAMVTVRGGKFSLIDRFSTLNEKGCGFRRDQTIMFPILRRMPEAEFKVILTDTVQQRHGDCGDKKPPNRSKTRISVQYKWDSKAMRYASSSDVLGKMQPKPLE